MNKMLRLFGVATLVVVISVSLIGCPGPEDESDWIYYDFTLKVQNNSIYDIYEVRLDIAGSGAYNLDNPPQLYYPGPTSSEFQSVSIPAGSSRDIGPIRGVVHSPSDDPYYSSGDTSVRFYCRAEGRLVHYDFKVRRPEETRTITLNWTWE